MRVLALEPYHGGSHRAFLDGWITNSRHDWTVLGLPAYKWKWRMRHSAIEFARMTRSLSAEGQRWDRLFCSDMLNLAEFRGLADPEVGRLPAVAYFHENQLTYPVEQEDERDYHYCLINMTTALAADAVWFNSTFHRDSFLDALRELLKRMPDHQPLEEVDRIEAKSSVRHPGIDELTPGPRRRTGPPRILWAARWEADKDPETFFAAMKSLKEQGQDFRLNVIGERFRQSPAVFDWAEQYFHDQIDRWGFQPNRREYEDTLREADIVVSTANQEFFGIGVAEAISAGGYPLLPNRLAYPELMSDPSGRTMHEYFFDGTAEGLATGLAGLLARRFAGKSLFDAADPARKAVHRFSWDSAAPAMDDSIEQMPSPKT